MNRRNFIKLATVTTAIIPPKKTIKKVETPLKDTISKIKKYRNVINTIKRDGEKMYTRRNFFGKSGLKMIEISRYSSFLSDASIANFGLPKSYLTQGTPVKRGVATRMFVRRTANGLSQVRPSNKIITTRTLRPKNYGLRAKIGL